MPLIAANGVDLHHEVRGGGPPVLFIGGLDGGTFAALAACIERAGFTTIVYDRRGHSRSPRPHDWSSTTIREQAADAAALLDALGVASAAVVGNSIGALIALELALHDRERVTGAVLLDTAPLESVIGEAAQRRPPAGGNPRESFEAFLRFVGAWDSLDATARERQLGNAGVFFGIDMPARGAYRPWLARQLRVEMTTTPGGHVGYLSCADQVAKMIVSFLR